MMKKLLLIITVLFITNFSFSQELSRYVVSSGGKHSSNGGYSISFTIGESIEKPLPLEIIRSLRDFNNQKLHMAVRTL